MKYRSRVDIIATILQAAMRGGSKTKLMYNAYLSYAQLKEYLSFLEDRGLLSYIEGTQTYGLSPKGVRFLDLYEEIRTLVTLNANKKLQTASPVSPSMSRRQLEMTH
jgi:predicted transcriptional regulator